LPDVGAALGLVQLHKLDGFNQRRQELAHQYLEKLPQHPTLILPKKAPGHSWHMFCVCLDCTRFAMTRNQLIEYFRQRGIGLGIHYPAMHLFPLYRRYGYHEGQFPNAEQIGAETLTLPLFPTMTDDELQQVCDVFQQCFEDARV